MKMHLTSLALAAATLSAAPTLFSPTAFAQAVSVNGGAIQGTITDPSGAAVPDAAISIASKDTGFKRNLTTDKAGFYAIGPLNPGSYTVTITATGFQTQSIDTFIRTGTATSGNFKLSIGSASTEISVQAGAVQVNTEQGGVSDVITKEQINSLPINGRNFLDIAQIEPGVILQSGESFDPTKAGYSAISVSGVSGRTTRILLDGQDITDENVGTTIFNVSQGAINEFQLNRSTQDVSGEVTSTGQVLVSTNSGTNSFHGQLFYQFQDARAGFATGAASNPPFQRNQYGGSIGGPIIKDKLFFFGNAERIKQDSATQASLGTTFAALQAAHPTLPTPYRETYSTIRLDYNGPLGGHYFVRGNYNVNSVTSNFGQGYQLYANRDNTPGIAGGADFASGRFTHSFRGSYEKFHNLIGDNSSASGYSPLNGVAYQFAAQNLYFGPNDNAPQGTFQSDKQFRYDGSWTKGTHNIRFGYNLNRIQGGGYAAFFGLGPYITTTQGKAIAGADPSDPINGYAVSSMYIGNGLGSFTERPGFGLPGGQTADWRQGAYVSDAWKITPSFTLVAGLRWSVDTDRANQDLAPTPCSAISAAIQNSGFSPCSGSSLIADQFQSGLGKRVHQPYANFGPQLGFNYAPGNHKTSFRGAIGIYYENDVFNNTTNARNSLLAQGPFQYDKNVCQGGNITFPNGSVVTSVNGVSINTLCGESVAAAAPFALALENQFKAASAANPLVANPGFVGNTLSAGAVYGAPYRTPYAEQFNFGVQRELFKGATLTADYVHNATLKIGQYVDLNHVGAARYFNKAAAQAAIARANTSVGCGAADVACGVAAGLTIEDYAGNGLDSGVTFLSGQAATTNVDPVDGVTPLTPNTGAAFPGNNPLVGRGQFIMPVGKSGYDALHMVFRQVANHPLPGIVSSNLQVSYAYSRAINTSANGNAGDAFFHNLPWDNDNPGTIMGRSGLDHKHEVNFGGSMHVKYGLQVGLIGHFYSAPPTSLTLDSSVLTYGNIYQSDLNGDGTTGDLLPGTGPGDYMHRVKSGNLQSYINTFNAAYAGKLTPAGQALVSNGLFTASQLTALHGTIRPIANLASSNAINNTAVRALDVNLSYPITLSRLREGMSLEPAVAFYNVGNFANFDNAGSVGGVLNNTDEATSVGGINTATGTRTGPNTYSVQNSNRILRQSGTFAQGAPRTAEFQLKLNF